MSRRVVLLERKEDTLESDIFKVQVFKLLYLGNCAVYFVETFEVHVK